MGFAAAMGRRIRATFPDDDLAAFEAVFLGGSTGAGRLVMAAAAGYPTPPALEPGEISLAPR
ncbi:MAG: hypothetical protein JNL97_15160 [Verrucomicrobiales bacterium]|nr:hypothetical protein [Verrucomicrobiales bacterium]